MLVVVRCPWCRGLSQVEPAAVGAHVRCPRCSAEFLALPDAAVAEPPAPAGRPVRMDWENWDDRPAADRPRRRPAEPETAEPADALTHPDAPGGLPLSVMIGLALLPFLVPLLWVIAPVVVNRPAELSLASPVALAVAASALCLAIVYTVDWSPGTRLKGVVILLAVAYLGGVGLYLLRKDMIDQVREAMADSSWKEFRPAGEGYAVRLPEYPGAADRTPPVDGWQLTPYRASRKHFTGEVTYYAVAAGPDPRPRLANPAWAAELTKKLTPTGWEVRETEVPVEFGGVAGWQWVFADAAGSVRVVRVARRADDRRVFFLSVEGPGLAPDDDDAARFLGSFRADPPRPR